MGLTAKIKCKILKLFKKAAKLKCHENILPLKYFFFIMAVNNINFFINTPDDMEVFYTLSSPKIVHITIFLLDTLLWRRGVYYEGKSKRARIHLQRFFYFKLWCWLERRLVRGSLLIEGFTVFFKHFSDRWTPKTSCYIVSFFLSFLGQ